MVPHFATEEGEPTEIFSFGLEQRPECLGCHRVRYRVDNTDALSLGVPVTEISEGEGATDATKVYAPAPLGLCLGLFLGGTGQEALEYHCEAGCGKHFGWKYLNRRKGRVKTSMT